MNETMRVVDEVLARYERQAQTEELPFLYLGDESAEPLIRFGKPYPHENTLREGPNTSKLPQSAYHGMISALLLEAVFAVLILGVWALWLLAGRLGQ